jgi:GNAT superfamily N-acetyltransferase
MMEDTCFGAKMMERLLKGPMESTDSEIIAEICRFRARVWKETGKLKNNAFGDDGWRDPIDSHCLHWVIRTEDDTLVAAGRLSIHDTLDEVHQAEEYRRYGLDLPGRVASPDRVVVCPSMQGHGLGWQILEVQDKTAVQQGAQHAVRQASPGMVRLLRRRGWNIVGPASSDPRFPGEVFHVAVVSFNQYQMAPNTSNGFAS